MAILGAGMSCCALCGEVISQADVAARRVRSFSAFLPYAPREVADAFAQVYDSNVHSECFEQWPAGELVLRVLEEEESKDGR